MKRARPPSEPFPPEVYRRILLEKRRLILDSLGPRFEPQPSPGYSEEDQAQFSHDEFVSLRLNSLDYLRLRLIHEALDRLGSGHYGICLACECAIPAKRLEALPWARYCLNCQQEVGAQQEQDMLENRPRPALLH